MPSSVQGQDWFEVAHKLDEVLTHAGMDLSEESTYLLYSHGPSDILQGRGQCLVARAVVGPKKNFSPPVQLIDSKSGPVWRETLLGESLEEVLESAEAFSLKLQNGSRTLQGAFVLRIRIELKEELILAVEGIFNE